MTCRKCGFEQKTIFFRGREVGDNFIWKIRSARGQRIFLILFTPLITFRPTKCPPFLRVEVIILRFGVRGHKDAVCFKCFSFSGRGRVTSYSGEFGENLCGFCRIIQLNIFKHRQVRCKKKHILPPQAATSSGFISPCRLRRDKSGFISLRRGKEENLRFWVKLRFAQWSEALRLRVFFAFSRQKNGVVDDIPTLDLLWRELKSLLPEKKSTA